MSDINPGNTVFWVEAAKGVWRPAKLLKEGI